MSVCVWEDGFGEGGDLGEGRGSKVLERRRLKRKRIQLL